MGQEIGFIGQGFIGKHMADDFVNRGYEVVRYGLEKEYVGNKKQIADCSIVFIAVPTPTTVDGFDASAVEASLAIVGKGSTAVIKSTILPGTTEKLQAKFPDLYVLHSPEFLLEKTAAENTAHPERNIIGIPEDNAKFRAKAKAVMAILPAAPYELITSAQTAECIKYVGNTFLYAKVVFMNIAHDFVVSANAKWDEVREAISNDKRIGHSHTEPVHSSGRGAGGHCFIKDFEAFRGFYEAFANDPVGLAALHALRDKNNALLMATKKDLDLLAGVYGKDMLANQD